MIVWNLEITSPNNIKWYPWKDKHACLSFQGYQIYDLLLEFVDLETPL